MSDWEKWDKLLGPGRESESFGVPLPPDPAGHDGTIIVRRRLRKKKQNGDSIFEIFMQAQPAGFAPTAATIVSLEVEGFVGEDCTGEKKCAQFAPVPAGAALVAPVAGGKLSFEPTKGDGGILSGLLAKCDCDFEGVNSYKIYITVEFTPPNPALSLRFSTCFPCGQIEE